MVVLPVLSRNSTLQLSARVYNIITRLLLLLILVFFNVSIHAAEPLVMGVFPRRDAAITAKLFRPLSRHLAKKLGMPVSLEMSPDFDTFLSNLKQRRYDLVHLNPFDYISAHDDLAYDALVQNEEFGEETIMGAIYVRKDSGIRQITELKGKKILFGGGPRAMMSYIVPTYLLQQAGLTKQDYEETYAINPPNAVLATYLQRADAGGAGEVVRRLPLVTSKIDVNQLEVIAISRPLPHLPWAVKQEMPAEFKQRLQTLMVNLKNSKKAHILGGEIDNPEELNQMRAKLLNGDICKSEFRNRRKNGRSCWESAVIAPIRDANGITTHFLAVKEDITERKAFEQKLLEQATHDQLTGLPNRFLAFDRLKQMLQHANRYQNRIGIIYIDLDNFKTVNDSLGHAFGDDLLIQVAKRIHSQLRAENTLCRLGGDEFMALVPDLQNPIEDLKVILNRMIASLQSPFNLNGRQIIITLSLGIALFPDDGRDVGTLMSHADIAMYEAKRLGRNTFCFFTPEMNKKIQEKMAMETRLRYALEIGELYPVYHPIIRLSDGALVGAETLLRWKHPELGNIAPVEFIPIAEQTGLIRPITDWLFTTVLEHAATWRHRPSSFWLSVNVPPTYFCEKPFRQTIEATVEQASEIGLELCVEITENLFLQHSAAAIENFKHLAELGVTSAMDDFGTGYSSLAYIKRFPLNYLKIDRTFVNGLPEDSEDRLLTDTIVLMGHRLGISIIAEGVETQAQLNYLRSIDVAYAQGYYMAKPMNNKAFRHYLDSLGKHRKAT